MTFMPTVLIVDDSPTESHVLQTIVRRHGYEALIAANGEQGIVIAIREQPNVILMDVVMPGMNGFQATRRLTKTAETAHIPVLLISTKDQETDRIWGMRQGAADYLTKPVNEQILISKIKGLVK
jgi:twitching motility two-component system response regulator PilH